MKKVFSDMKSPSTGMTLVITLTMIFAVLFTNLSLVRAEDAKSNSTAAKALLDKGEYDKALEAYTNLFRQDPQNPDINFNLGRAAFEKGDYETAIMAFERVLIEKPDTARARLEIARSYFHLGSFEASEQYFKEVLDENPPEMVRTNILRYLEAIRSTRREHFFSARISLGTDFDDNVNAAPKSPEIDIILGDVPTTQQVSSPEKDQIRTSTANLSYLYRPMDDDLSWKLSGTTYNAVYHDSENLDLNLFDFKAGPVIGRQGLVWEIYGLFNHLNLDYSQYQRSYGMGTGIRYSLSPAIVVSVDGKIRKKNYFNDTPRDSNNLSISLTPEASLGTSRFSLSAGWEREKARDDVYTYDRLNATAYAEISLPYSSSLFLSYWYQGTGYKDEYPLFQKNRNDDMQYLSAGLTKTLAVFKTKTADIALDLIVSYTYTRADSTIDLYTYTKNVVSTSMSVSF